MADFDDFLRDATTAESDAVSARTRERLARTYGTRYRRVVERLDSSSDDRGPLGAACPVTVGEVRHAVREEMAVKLGDALLRRTEAGSAGHPGDDAVSKAAAVMAGELAWTRQRMEREITELRRTYQLPR